MFDAKFNDEVRFFAGNYELSGINSLDLSYNSNNEAKTILGTKRGFTTISGPVQQTLSINKNFIYNDPILRYTGIDPIAASVYYDDTYYGFEKAYLTDYSISCAVGAIPKCSANFIITDEMKTGISGARKRVLRKHPVIDLPSQGSISITCDHATTNRVVGFNYSIKSNRKLHYGIGQKGPYDVELIHPISYTANASIDIDDAFLKDSYSFLDNRENKNLSITINGRDGKRLQSVNIPNASLVSESMRVSQEGGLRLEISYVGHG